MDRDAGRLAGARLAFVASRPTYVVLKLVAKDTWKVLGEVERKPGRTGKQARADAIEEATKGKAKPDEQYRAILRSEWRIGGE